jgi:hypothetical protein
LVLAGSPGLTIATTGGDINIAMLGFSSDSKYFVMTALSTADAAGVTSAKIMIINVATNKCVRGGCKRASKRVSEEDAHRTEEDVIEKDVIEEVLKKTWLLRRKLQLTPLRGYWAKGHFDGSSTAVYNYVHKKIRVHLLQKVNEAQMKASMQLEVSMGNVKKTLDSLNNYRDSALKYQLDDSLFISPNEKCFAFLVKVHYPDGDYDFIVQTVKF